MISNHYKLLKIQREIAYYEEKISSMKTDKDELNSNKDMLEKFAREKYLMKRQNEEIFLVEEPETKW
jgi:cell division protein FtsB